MQAWKDECKGLYYLRTETSHRAENVAEKVKLNKLNVHIVLNESFRKI